MARQAPQPQPGSRTGAGYVKLRRQALQAQIRNQSTAPPPVVITPDSAALVLTGFAPTVATPRLVAPGTATLTLTGRVPTISTPRLVTPAKASLTLTGFAPAVATPRAVSPATAALILTGFAPTASVPHSVSIAPAAAQLSLVGYSPEVAGDLHTGDFGHVVSDTGRRRRFPLPPEQPFDPVQVMPPTARLRLTGYPPTIVKASAVAFTLEELAALSGELSDEEIAALLAA